MMTQLDRLATAVAEGFNQVSIHHSADGATLTLMHKATSDNAVTIFLPYSTEMVFWADAEEDEVNNFHP